MDAEDDNTVIRPRAIPEVDAAIPDDDTIIRERVPFADLAPIFEEVARRAGLASAPFALVEPNRASPAASVPVVERARPQLPPVDDSSRTAPVYRFRVNNHEPIALDAPAILGRKPSAPRVTRGPLARLVRVPSPLREVSSTHLELRQHGSSVIVTDLGSTNGTIITVPGFSAQKLLQGESVVVSAGTVVDIGDGNLVEILPVERVSAAGG
ncbi:FHA domain-containing protein [Lacisediminihabitans profunda]|uniref:FHA domain-containing protein n=1 Tax=Lacisediminihabitans profunda TaxID=2594790 RepID=A0A5C8UJY5_9MICO|nr:FHA domain-containing protein [Lacisediminihabitans profunda]TXN28526.1 FHA domain-containing protein [Lacisediminihabitans profunda]